mgnify:CR=1 FL=1
MNLVYLFMSKGMSKVKRIHELKEKYKNVDLFNKQSSHFETHKLKKINVIIKLIIWRTEMLF